MWELINSCFIELISLRRYSQVVVKYSNLNKLSSRKFNADGYVCMYTDAYALHYYIELVLTSEKSSKDHF